MAIGSALFLLSWLIFGIVWSIKRNRISVKPKKDTDIQMTELQPAQPTQPAQNETDAIENPLFNELEASTTL